MTGMINGDVSQRYHYHFANTRDILQFHKFQNKYAGIVSMPVRCIGYGRFLLCFTGVIFRYTAR